MSKLASALTLLFASVQLCPLLHAQEASVSLEMCNAGTVDLDVFISHGGNVSTSHVGPADCATVAKSAGSMGATYIGLAFVDARRQWGAARRQDLFPFWGNVEGSDEGVLSRSKKSIPVPHGGATVTLPMQLLFRPPTPTCSYDQHTSLIPFGATASQAAAIRSRDRMASGKTICDQLKYSLNVLAYTDSREITFKKFCDSCDKKAEARITPEERAAGQRQASDANRMMRTIDSVAGYSIMGSAVNLGNEELKKEREERRRELAAAQRVNWHDMPRYLGLALPDNTNLEPMNQKLIVQATVSSVELPLPGASEPWVKVYFAEAPEKRFSIVTLGGDIFEETFGQDFSSRMIGKKVEVEGRVTRAYCSYGCIRVSLARQLRLVGTSAGMVAAVEPPNITFPELGLTAEGEAAKRRMDEGTRRYEVERQNDAARRKTLDKFVPEWMGQNLIITGTVSRVQQVRKDDPYRWQMFFEESPSGAFTACLNVSLNNDWGPDFRRPDFPGLIGKSVQVAGLVKERNCAASPGVDMNTRPTINVAKLPAGNAPPVAGGAAPAIVATAVAQPRSAAPGSAPPATIGLPAASPAADSGQAGDLRQRYGDLMRRSAPTRTALGRMEQQLARQRLGLRSDIANARTRMDTQLRIALDAINRGDASQAEEGLRNAAAALDLLEQFLGR